MFVNITVCSGSNPSVGSEAYLVVLTAAVLFFAFQNMKIKNRFRLEGVATCLAVVIVAIFYLIYIVTIHVFLTGAYYYRTVFQLTAVFCIVIPPTAVLILFMPKVSCLDTRLMSYTSFNFFLFVVYVDHSLDLCIEITGKKYTKSLNLKLRQRPTDRSIIAGCVSKWHS